MFKGPSFEVSTLESEVQKNVPGSFIERQVGNELLFTLPSELVSNFYGLFQQMEQNQDRFGIESYGISVTTIEEVFLRVGKLLEEDEINENNFKRVASTASYSAGLDELEDLENTSKKDGAEINFEYNESAQKCSSKMSLWYQQFQATVVKRVIHSMRNKKVAIAQLLIPALCTSFALLVTKIADDDLDSPERKMLLSEYDSPFTLFAGNALDQTSGSLIAAYGQIVNDQSNKGSRVTFVNTSTIEDEIVILAEQNLARYNNRMMVAAEFYDTITVWYNNVAYHTASLSLNLISNAILLASDAAHTISVSNHPLPQTIDDSAENLSDVDAVWQGFNVGFNISFGFAFLVASFVIFPVKERATKSKHLQYVSGLQPAIFWLSAFFWDVLNFLASVAVLMLLFAAFQVDAYSGSRLLFLLLIFCGYSIAALPMMYSIAFFFEDSVSAFVRCTTLNIVLSVGTLITISILDNDKSITNTLDWTFVVLIPQYAIPITMLDLYRNYEAHKFCDDFGGLSDEQCELVFPNDFEASYFSWERPGVGRYPVFYIIHSIFWWTVLICVESNIVQSFKNLFSTSRKVPKSKKAEAIFADQSESTQFAKDDKLQNYEASSNSEPSEGLDIDVRNEIDLVKNSIEDLKQSSTLVVEGLNKSYITSEFLFSDALVTHAVKDIYLSVPAAECFGLLGINGAGKTTTFKMLTGDIRMTSGTAYIKGVDISRRIKDAQQMMGYCPQFDALIDQMTGRETLRMYGRLRGKIFRTKLTSSHFQKQLSVEKFSLCREKHVLFLILGPIFVFWSDKSPISILKTSRTPKEVYYKKSQCQECFCYSSSNLASFHFGKI